MTESHSDAVTVTSNLVSFFVHLPAKPGRRLELERLLISVVEEMKLEPDFINAWIHHSLDNPDLIVVYETWSCTREDFVNRHMKKEYRKEYEAALPDLLATPRTIEFLFPFAEYVKEE
jgi:quinol monooxygenase YgiN